MKKVLFILALLLTLAVFAEEEPQDGHYELSPLSWKGSFNISLTGFLPAAGLNEFVSNQKIGLYNLWNDIYVGMKVVPVKKATGNYVFREMNDYGLVAEFVYTISSGKFTYKDRYAEDFISILTYNEKDDMYYSNELTQGIGKIKGQGKIFDSVMPYFNDGYGITLYNSDEETPFAVSDSIVTCLPVGQNFAYSGEPYAGTKVKVTVKKRTGKVNFKMKVTKDPNTINYTSVVPSLIWFVPDPPKEDKE
ncbi:hypothetical protein J6U76_06660 [bacterium]|nr:hypothetical protein [bacterium]